MKTRHVEGLLNVTSIVAESHHVGLVGKLRKGGAQWSSSSPDRSKIARPGGSEVACPFRMPKTNMSHDCTTCKKYLKYQFGSGIRGNIWWPW
ncbi:hypothetical protein TNCV_1694901 [Trichonephila clavipes]|nr:hypothetical protein TNCV_1694901 [Trichonephila clavipes]